SRGGTAASRRLSGGTRPADLGIGATPSAEGMCGLHRRLPVGLRAVAVGKVYRRRRRTVKARNKHSPSGTWRVGKCAEGGGKKSPAGVSPGVAQSPRVAAGGT